MGFISQFGGRKSMLLVARFHRRDAKDAEKGILFPGREMAAREKPSPFGPGFATPSPLGRITYNESRITYSGGWFTPSWSKADDFCSD